VVTRLGSGAEAVLAPGRGFALVLDDHRLWRVPDSGVLQLNGSSPHALTTARWDAYPRGSSLGG
jgi:hypothetical protein